MDIYTYLEEQNLKRIRESQDVEDQLEFEKARENRNKKEIGKKIHVIEGVKKDLEQQIVEARASLNELQK